MHQIVPQLNIPGVLPCAGYHACIVNERIALAERHIQPVPVLQADAKQAWDEAFELLENVLRPKKMVKLTQKQCVSMSSSKRRARMQRAYDNINKHGDSVKRYNVKSFLKWEKYEDDPLDPLESKAPRLIQHRSDEYCYDLARWLKALEKRVLYSKINGRRWCTKGMKPNEIGKLIGEACDEWSHFVKWLLDHSRYDAHLQAYIRSKCHEYILKWFNNDRNLQRQLKRQIRNSGRTMNGLIYHMLGTLCSGDFNTSLEGSLTNLAAILYVFRHTSKIPIVNGDDSNVLTPAGARVDPDDFAKLGLKTKIEPVGDRWQGNFCQLSLVDTVKGPLAVRNPFRVMSRTPYTCKTYTTIGAYRKYIGAVGLCEMACNVGVPVLQDYAEMLFRSAGRYSTNEYKQLCHIRGGVEFTQSAPIDEQARLSFFLAFGMPPDQQIALESLFRRTTLPFEVLSSRTP
jgi:hypothetical protein